MIWTLSTFVIWIYKEINPSFFTPRSRCALFFPSAPSFPASSAKGGNLHTLSHTFQSWNSFILRKFIIRQQVNIRMRLKIILKPVSKNKLKIAVSICFHQRLTEVNLVQNGWFVIVFLALRRPPIIVPSFLRCNWSRAVLRLQSWFCLRTSVTFSEFWRTRARRNIAFVRLEELVN